MGALNRRGYAMLADDVTAVTVDPASGPVAFSSIPRLRLCLDAATRLGYPSEERPRVRRTDKCLVNVTHFCPEPLPVHAIYALNVHEAPTIELETLDTIERFPLIAENTYRYQFLKGLGLRKMHFQAATQMARTVHVGRITRPASPYLLDELVDRLEEELGTPLGVNTKREVS